MLRLKVLFSFLIVLTLLVLSATVDADATDTNDRVEKQSAAQDPRDWRDAARNDQYMSTRDALETALNRVKKRDEYIPTLVEWGFTVTAVNEYSPTRVEYEVVQNDSSYEVIFDFGSAEATRAESVAVQPNIWRSGATRAAILNEDLNLIVPGDADTTPQYRDEVHMKNFSSDRYLLISAMSNGMTLSEIHESLAALDFKITAINEDNPLAVEYEVVKGNNSFEVQLQFDEPGGVTTSAQVERNLWLADETERALATQAE